MIDAFGQADLRKKILITLGLLVIFRFVAHVPVPGADLEAMREFLAGGTRAGSLGGMLHLFSGTVSPGLTDELYHAFLGLNLKQVGEGGGTGGEQIEVRYVPFTQLLMFVLEAARVGDLVDSKIITHITLALGKLDEMARLANTEDKSKV